MLDTERVDWLANLKPGDLVAVLNRDFGLPSYSYWKIKNITAKRTRFDLERDGSRDSHVDKYGKWPRMSSYTAPEYIEPLTDQVRYANKLYHIKSKLEKALKLTEPLKLDLSADQMQRIIGIIEELIPNADINLPKS